MPNHITNILTVHGDRAPEVFSGIKGYYNDDPNDAERLIDFNKIIPMPKELVIESTGETFEAEALFKQGLEPTENHAPRIHFYYENLKKFGHTCWYGWAIKNWGTKWNAYSQKKIDDSTIEFETAWASPFPVLEALSRLYPETELEVKFADEDLGYNCGHVKFRNGEIIDLSPDLNMGTPEARKFACEVTGREYHEEESEEE